MNILQLTCVLKVAAGQAGRIMERIRSLSEMPMRYRLHGGEPWHSRGLRFPQTVKRNKN